MVAFKSQLFLDNPGVVSIGTAAPYRTACCASQARVQDSTVPSLISVASRNFLDILRIVAVAVAAAADDDDDDDDVGMSSDVACSLTRRTLNIMSTQT